MTRKLSDFTGARRFLLCVPVFGHIGRCLYTAKVLRQMASKVSQNVPLPDALEQCAGSMRNDAYRRDCRRAAVAARSGMSFAEIALRYYWLFPAWLAPMLAVDNVRESLPKSLRRVAETVEQQQDVSILLLQALAMPLSLVFLCEMIAVLIIAMFLPLIKLITGLSG